MQKIFLDEGLKLSSLCFKIFTDANRGFSNARRFLFKISGASGKDGDRKQRAH